MVFTRRRRFNRRSNVRRRRVPFSRRRAMRRGTRRVRARKSVPYAMRVYEYPFVTKALVTMAPTFTAADLNTVQYVLTGQFDLTTSASADLRLRDLQYIHQYYKLKRVYLTLEPEFGFAANNTGYQMGDVYFIPIHSQADVVQCGLGGFGLLSSDLSKWTNKGYSRKVKFANGMYQKTTFSLHPSYFRYAIENSTWGIAGAVATHERTFTKSWLDTRDYDGGTWQMSYVYHYGFALMFAGFDVPVGGTPLRWKLTKREQWVFKGYDPTATIPTVGAAAGIESLTIQDPQMEYTIIDVQHGLQWKMNSDGSTTPPQPVPPPPEEKVGA